MPQPGDRKIPGGTQPKAGDYAYDLDRALRAVVAVSARVPANAFTAEALGTERAGNGVVIREDGLVLTMNYLILEAETVWLTTGDGRVVPGHVVGHDGASGFGLVQALQPLGLPVLRLGRAAALKVGDAAVLAGAGGRQHCVAARIVSRQEFAGYWEYLLDEALFTAPAHPHWGGTALIGPQGELAGIGSLQLQQGGSSGPKTINMIVPVDLLLPVLDDLVARGRPDRPPRPWLGLYAADAEDGVVVIGLADDGPAELGDLRTGDLVEEVAGERVADLADLYRRIWALGEAGVRVPLTLRRDGKPVKLAITSGDRDRFLVGPMLH